MKAAAFLYFEHSICSIIDFYRVMHVVQRAVSLYGNVARPFVRLSVTLRYRDLTG